MPASKHDEWARRVDDRLAMLEKLGEHCSDPEDREVDEYLRKIIKSARGLGWLVKHLTIIAGMVIAAKMAWEQIKDMVL